MRRLLTRFPVCRKKGAISSVLLLKPITRLLLGKDALVFQARRKMSKGEIQFARYVELVLLFFLVYFWHDVNHCKTVFRVGLEIVPDCLFGFEFVCFGFVTLHLDEFVHLLVVSAAYRYVLYSLSRNRAAVEGLHSPLKWVHSNEQTENYLDNHSV